MVQHSPKSNKATQAELSELANFLYSQYENQKLDTSKKLSDDESEDPFLEIQELQ